MLAARHDDDDDLQVIDFFLFFSASAHEVVKNWIWKKNTSRKEYTNSLLYI